MSNDGIDNTFSAYLGHDFQQKLMWQLLVEPEFAERTIPNLEIEYFDDPNLKRLFVIIIEFLNEYEKVPNLQNKSIELAINKFKTPNNPIEEEALFGVLSRIKLWNERIINKQILHDGDVIQKSTIEFIKQQEYRKIGEFILDKTKNGEIRNKKTLHYIEDRFLKTAEIGNEDETSEEISDNIERSLRENFRETIPTGIDVLDTLTGGGLGKSEMGLILAPMGTGKAQPISSKLLTPDGWIKMGDVKVGDLVIGSDGKPQKVLDVFPQGIRPIYKVDFSDETSTFCDKEHIWSVNTLKQRSYKYSSKKMSVFVPDKSYIQLTVGEMINNFYLKNRKYPIYNYRIPKIKPVQFKKRDLKIHPYVMGVLIGNGCVIEKNELYIINTDKFIVDKICKLHPQINIINFNRKKEEYKEIPYDYLYSSLEDRIDLLNGLLDTNSTSTLNSDCVIYTTTSHKLSENVRELVLSIGGTCSICKKHKKFNDKNGEKKLGKELYYITILFPENINIKSCSPPRKLKKIKCRKKYSKNKYIKNITYSHEEEAQCILVENPDHLYVTDDYILTHNTTILTKIVNTAYEVGRNVAHIIFEDNIDDIKRKHYTIWSKIPLSKLDKNKNYVIQVANEKTRVLNKYGRLVIKKFTDDGTTILDIRNWLLSYQKKNGFKFDEIVLDYLDCLESHKRTSDQIQNEFVIVKGFNALISELDIPGWSAIQSNRQGIEAEIVEAYQMGGSIKRGHKAHFLMSIAKIEEQKLADLATIKIIKSRFVKDGYVFRDCIFNNDSLVIEIEDDRFKNVKSYVKQMKHENMNIVSEEKNVIEQSSDLEIHNKINEYTQEILINDNNLDNEPNENIININNNNDIDIKKIQENIINKGMLIFEEQNENNDQPIENNNEKSIMEILMKKRETQKIIKEDKNDRN